MEEEKDYNPVLKMGGTSWMPGLPNITGSPEAWAIDEMAEEKEPPDCCFLIIVDARTDKDPILVKNESEMHIPENTSLLKVNEEQYWMGLPESFSRDEIPMNQYKILTEEEYDNLSEEAKENVEKFPEMFTGETVPQYWWKQCSICGQIFNSVKARAEHEAEHK